MKVKREKLALSQCTSQRVLVGGVLSKGNRWFWWWPDGMKMSGFVGNGKRGRLVEVT